MTVLNNSGCKNGADKFQLPVLVASESHQVKHMLLSEWFFLLLSLTLNVLMMVIKMMMMVIKTLLYNSGCKDDPDQNCSNM